MKKLNPKGNLPRDAFMCSRRFIPRAEFEQYNAFFGEEHTDVEVLDNIVGALLYDDAGHITVEQREEGTNYNLIIANQEWNGPYEKLIELENILFTGYYVYEFYDKEIKDEVSQT